MARGRATANRTLGSGSRSVDDDGRPPQLGASLRSFPMSRTVLVVAGGDPPSPEVSRALPPAAMCIAADSGIDHARALGLTPDLAVGDFDSVSSDGLKWVIDLGATVARHPAAKNETDLELALDAAIASEPDQIVVIAIAGGRTDHLLANISLLARSQYRGPEVDAYMGTSVISVIHDRRTLDGEVGETLTLLPVGGDVGGVTTTGLRYPLDREPLPAGTTRGVSNVFDAPSATVSIESGVLLAIRPDRLRAEGL